MQRGGIGIQGDGAAVALIIPGDFAVDINAPGSDLRILNAHHFEDTQSFDVLVNQREIHGGSQSTGADEFVIPRNVKTQAEVAGAGTAQDIRPLRE